MLPALLLPAVLACATAGIQKNGALKSSVRENRSLELPQGCLYEGRWHAEGAPVSTRQACLSCACARGALSCRHRACAPLPDPPPARCHVLHRRGACCPELHCPNGVTNMEHGASARFEIDDFDDIATPSSITHACVEGGMVYAAGSAMVSAVACEQCFCLGGARRCVRPSCLPPPPGCAARSAAGACCPHRYYCTHETTKPPDHHHQHDCKVEGRWVQEGDRISPHDKGECTACFCLRGAMHCQPLACAPPLLGCEPMRRPGECCAHQYNCSRSQYGQLSQFHPLSSNALRLTKNEDRALHLSHTSRLESTTKNIQTSVYIMQNTPLLSATKNHLFSTTKVKRKTSDPPPTASELGIGNVTVTNSTKSLKAPATKTVATTKEAIETTTDKTTEQPDGTVKIVINGTINCTAELSSTSMPLNMSVNDTDQIKMEALPRIPIVNTAIEAQTYSPNDIITDRNVNGDFDENEMFTINVTSSLVTNTSHPTANPVAMTSKLPVKIGLVDTINSSKKTKGDYDYDYTEPTLPPSLPNLKIIPFVAADAVVEDEPPKDTLTYPIIEREDKFPIYYPTSKDTAYPIRREDVYNPTQYPIFITDKESSEYPAIAHEMDLTSNKYNNELKLHEYAVSTALGAHLNDGKAVTKVPITSSTYEIETPAVNLFSPPVETEGGFIPKGPGIIDEYYGAYPSTPPGTAVPHLTTSMQLYTKGECISADGRHVPEGDSISLACSECRCDWGELHCAPRGCPTPANCRRLPPGNSAADLCCGDLICEDKTTTSTSTTKKGVDITKLEIERRPETTTSPSTLSPRSTTEINSTIEEEISDEDTDISFTANDDTAPPINETGNNTTITTTTQKQITTTPLPIFENEYNDTSSQEYEDDDDEGFSFGSVLKLLLSDTYETTTTKKPATKVTTVPIVAPGRKPSSIMPFIPLPPRPFIPSKLTPNTVNRIDHLVLGEATAIRKTTPRPLIIKTTPRPTSTTTRPTKTTTTTTRPTTTTTRPTTTTTRPTQTTPRATQTTTRAVQTTKPTQRTTRPVVEEALSVTREEARPPNVGLPAAGLGSGLLKLAGCNIYGRMYRVGRIIAELSTPCQECWCTEFGVQCKQLGC